MRLLIIHENNSIVSHKFLIIFVDLFSPFRKDNAICDNLGILGFSTTC